MNSRKLLWSVPCLMAALWAGFPSAAAPPPSLSLAGVAVVDYNHLLRTHKSSTELQEMLGRLRDRKAVLEMSPGAAQLREERERAAREWEREKSLVDARLRSLSTQFQGELTVKAGSLQEQARRDFHEWLRHHQQPDENLGLLRQHSITARKLQLEKSLTEAEESERARLDSRLSAYELQLQGSHREELLNLNLKLRLTHDEAEERLLTQKIQRLRDESEQARAAERARAAAEFRAFCELERSKFELAFRDYEKLVDSEVRQKTVAPGALQAEQARLQERTRGQLESLQAGFKARLAHEQELAAQGLRQKQADLALRLRESEDRLRGLRERQRQEFAREQAAYDQRLAAVSREIDLKVGEVAEKQRVSIVLRDVRYSAAPVSDLTDLSTVAVKQIK